MSHLIITCAHYYGDSAGFSIKTIGDKTILTEIRGKEKYEVMCGRGGVI
jgi:hypothetical protein